MAGRVVLAVLAAVTMAGCDDDDSPKGCAGASVIVSANNAPSCVGRCFDYLEMVRAGIEASTPAMCSVRLMDARSLQCWPASSGSCAAPAEDAGALQTQISDYLAASWPELDAPTLNTCACYID